MLLLNDDCRNALEYLKPENVDLLICDPPFGLKETQFESMYNRKPEHVVGGYVEAPSNPKDYYRFTVEWLRIAKKVMKPNASFFIISSWTNADLISLAIRRLGLEKINKIIWRYSFGVYTKKKFVTSHYEIFYGAKKKAKRTFNTFARSSDTRGSYQDRIDVWNINRENQPGQSKNSNKLPTEIVRKMIQYASNEGDIVCDFFLGNFTTAMVGLEQNREVCGFEKSKELYDAGMERLNKMVT